MISHKFKLYKSKNTKHLDNMLREACFVWNHALALQKRYYKIYGQYCPVGVMKKHFVKRIKRTYLHSQSYQEILERLDKAYKRFFKHTAKRPPKFKRHKDMTSFLFKQSGYSFNGNSVYINACKHRFKFCKSRDFQGNVKTVAFKKSPLGDWYIVIVTDAYAMAKTKTHNGASVGIDFGLKTFLTTSDGERIENPQYLKQSLRKLRSASKKHSKCKKGSHHKEQARLALCRVHEDVKNRRDDFQWKLAHELCKVYDYIFLEDLNLRGMVKLWGRKVNDLAFGEFVLKLEYVASKYGCVVHKIGRFYPSSKLCDCGFVNDKLSLRDREWVCPVCGQVYDRDVHAAKNILSEGIRSLESDSKTRGGSMTPLCSHVCIQGFHVL